MSHYSMIVEGMSSGQCEKAIKEALDALNGIENVIIDLSTKKVVIEFDEEKISPDVIKGVVEDLGYSVK